ncbi:MAG: NADH-quinone oxidoreductase subunit M, partial [Rhodospirillaceae bacterium]|nr:NADH-quinone oxidoreductase subunit M [Rhodospirillaceae bacterium]
MTNAWPVLSLVTFLPLAGCFFIMLTRGDEESVAKSSQYIALWTSIPTFIISLFIWINFNPNSPGFQMIERVPWMPSIGISYQMGIDGISIFFILLATFLTPICIFATWKTLKHHVREYMIVMLVLETALVGSFCALDMLVFVCFFESSLIPIFLMIG